MPPELTALLETYRERGVVRVPSLLSAADVSGVRAELERYTAEVLPALGPSEYVLEADGEGVRNLWRLEAHSDFFASLGNREDLLGLVGSLVGGEPVLLGVETFNKPARHGSGVPPHQDNAYFCQAPPDALTVWVAIDAASEENGPVNYSWGTQAGMAPHRASGIPGNSMLLAEPPELDPERQVVGVLEPGDAMIHHCQTIHWSVPNTTDRARCGLLMVYRAAHTTNDLALKGAYEDAQAAFRQRG